jgi:hypothetical protein
MAINVRKLFSFTDWAAHRPTEQLPAERLDAELAALRKGIVELSRQLDDIRRDDGKLRPELITAELISENLSTALATDIKQQLSSEFTQIKNASSQAVAAVQAAEKGSGEVLRKADQAIAAAKFLEGLKQSTFERLSAAEKVAQQAADDAAAERRAIELRLQGSRQSGGPGDGGASEAWADCSRAWAEFMDGNATIPMDLIAQTDVTGDHWSARWWAHRAGEIVGESLDDFFRYYIGAYNQAPSECPNGDPLTAGVLYYDTSAQTMFVWDGDSWRPLVVPSPGDFAEYFYKATAGQTVFGGADWYGKVPSGWGTTSTNLNVYLNGVRLTERLNWEVRDDASIVLKRGVTENSIVVVECFKVPETSYAATAAKIETQWWDFDGTKRAFPIYVRGVLYSPVDAANVWVSIDGVMQDPGVNFTISGPYITFDSAPRADAVRWGIVGVPVGAGGEGGAVAGSSEKMDTSSWVFDGVSKQFPIIVLGAPFTPGKSADVLLSIDGVMQDPGIDFTVSGSVLTFAVAPSADAKEWGVVGYPLGSGGGGGEITLGVTSFLRCVFIAQTAGQTTFTGSDKYNHILTGLLSLGAVVSVHVNGVLLEDDQWLVASDDTLQLVRGAAAGSSITIDVFTVDVSNGGTVTVPDHNHDAGVF